jgi:hypothetical protein
VVFSFIWKTNCPSTSQHLAVCVTKISRFDCARVSRLA